MTTAGSVTPFRAGGDPGGSADGHDLLAQAHAAGTKVLLADVSEFQPDVADDAYLAWSHAIVIRAAYGASHDDRAWYGGDRRKRLHDGGVRFLGIYQYITAFEDVTAQAREFCRLVGTLRPGEYPLADWEEGSGSQSARRAAWNHVVFSELGFPPGTGYSGLNYARDHGLAPVEWLAAYQGTEPPDPHLLWQFSSSFAVPGVGTADCSVFHGTMDQLAAHAYGSSPPAPPATAPAFPWGSGHYIGVESSDPRCHSGYYAADRPHIAQWQAQMAWRGWPVTPDGSYSHADEAACQAFQREKGLADDGKVGSVTWPATWTAPVT